MISSLLKKIGLKKDDTSELWGKGYASFRKGFDDLKARNDTSALIHFDNAINLGYEDDNIYGLRGTCLQSLHFHYNAIEDFNIEIRNSTHNCSQFFSRAISKMAILDYRGAVKDFEKAIALSQEEDFLNEEFNDEANAMGSESGMVGLIMPQLMRAQTWLAADQRSLKSIEEAESKELREIKMKRRSNERMKKLSSVKKR